MFLARLLIFLPSVTGNGLYPTSVLLSNGTDNPILWKHFALIVLLRFVVSPFGSCISKCNSSALFFIKDSMCSNSCRLVFLIDLSCSLFFSKNLASPGLHIVCPKWVGFQSCADGHEHHSDHIPDSWEEIASFYPKFTIHICTVGDNKAVYWLRIISMVKRRKHNDDFSWSHLYQR